MLLVHTLDSENSRNSFLLQDSCVTSMTYISPLVVLFWIVWDAGAHECAGACAWPCVQRKMLGPLFYTLHLFPEDSISHWIWHWAGSQKTSVILLFLLPIMLGSQAHMVIGDSLLGCRDPDSADILSACSSPFSRCLWWGSLPHLDCPGSPCSYQSWFLPVFRCHVYMHALLCFLSLTSTGNKLGKEQSHRAHSFGVAFSGQRPAWLLVEIQ